MTELFEHPAKWWKAVGAGKYKCSLCPHHCLLKDGQKGVCFGRKATKDALVTINYGCATGLAVDPVEKKPLYHFYPGSNTLSFGTIGCNLSCNFCQNWHITKTKTEDLLRERSLTPEIIVNAAKSNNCDSVSFTYNDPVTFAEFAIDVAKACHANGLKTIAVTAGYIEGPARQEFFEHMDAVNIDLKGFSDDFYKSYCKGTLAPVLDTLKYVAQKTDAWLEVTNLLIPGANDKSTDLKEMCRWIFFDLGAHIPVHFSAFHPDCELVDRPSTSPKTVHEARQIAAESGLVHVYTGNFRDEKGSTSFCAKCRARVIVRDGFRVIEMNLKGNKCGRCGEKIEGHFRSGT